MTSNMSNAPVNNSIYTTATGTAQSDVFITFLSDRDPSPSDVQFPVKKRWVNTTTGDEFILTGYVGNSGINTAIWLKISQGKSQDITQITVDTGTSPILPDVNGNINITSSDNTISVNGSAADKINLTIPKPPAFLYTANSEINITGNGDPGTVSFANVVFDQYNNFDGTFFTAPITGNYFFSVAVTVSNLTGANTRMIVELVANTKRYQFGNINAGADFETNTGNKTLTVNGSVIVPMTAAIGTVSAVVTVYGGAKDISTYNEVFAALNTFISGYLVV